MRADVSLVSVWNLCALQGPLSGNQMTRLGSMAYPLLIPTLALTYACPTLILLLSYAYPTHILYISTLYHLVVHFMHDEQWISKHPAPPHTPPFCCMKSLHKLAQIIARWFPHLGIKSSCFPTVPPFETSKVFQTRRPHVRMSFRKRSPHRPSC